MMLDRPPSETIRVRRSVRNYSPEDIPPDLLDQLERACSSLPPSPFGERARFRVIERPFKRGEPVRLGNYGLQRNPRYFLVGSMEESPTARVGYGYILEHLVLRATELGLGSCWMGYFNPEYFPETAGEGVTPAIAVVGNALEPRLGERFVRAYISADRRKPWDHFFFDGDFGRPLTMAEAGAYAKPLEMVRLGPSTGNTQPVRVVRGAGDSYHFHLQTVNRKYYSLGDHHVDTGIAMSHLELVAREEGLAGEWRVDDPGLPLPARTEYIVTWNGL